MNEMKSIQLYNSLIEKLDAHETKLFQKYGEFISCKKGCSACCILESVFPVDAFVIYNAIISGEIDHEFLLFEETPERCVFLKDSLCSIYSARPVICRTHGYPVLVDGKADFCPENFKGLKSIDSEYILDLENLNKALASINIIFQREIEEDELFLKERITLKELKEFALEKIK
jgi:Fe-S-cluster containining protein